MSKGSKIRPRHISDLEWEQRYNQTFLFQEQESIAGPAFRFPDGFVTEAGDIHAGIELSPERRTEINSMRNSEYMKAEGFLTSMGRFVSRKEAVVISQGENNA